MKGNDWKEKVKTIFRLRFLLPVSLGAVLAAVILRIVQLNVAVDFGSFRVKICDTLMKRR